MSILPYENVLQRPQQAPEIPGVDHFVRVPDDKYVAEFIGAEGFWYRGRSPRVVLWFVITEGQYEGQRVPAYCNVRSFTGGCSGRTRQPRFKVGWGSNLVAFIGNLYLDIYSPTDLPTEIPERDMMGRRILIETRTNCQTHDGTKRSEPFHNSVVKSVLGWAE